MHRKCRNATVTISLAEGEGMSLNVPHALGQDSMAILVSRQALDRFYSTRVCTHISSVGGAGWFALQGRIAVLNAPNLWFPASMILFFPLPLPEEPPSMAQRMKILW